MQDNPITDTESETPYLDAEDWQIALKPYEGNPQAALTLGIHLVELKQRINNLNMHDALEAINVAIDCLYHHSDFLAPGAGYLRAPSKENSQPTRNRCFVNLGCKSKMTKTTN